MTAAIAAKSASPTVVIFDGSDDIVELLEVFLSQRGYHAIVAQAKQVKSGELDVIAFLERYTPDTIIWDIAPPYERNWNLFKLLRTARPLKHCGIVLTTTQTQTLDPLMAGETDAVEIVGKPYSLTRIDEAVARGVEHAHRAACC
jgi:DNA-binding response OmpR family regulator